MKARIFILASVFLLVFNLAIPTTVLSENGPPKKNGSLKNGKAKVRKLNFNLFL